jgi:hypothetical protein
MKQVPLILLFTDKIKSIELNEQNFKIKVVQVRKTATYGDLKKRICDCTSKLLNQSLKLEQIRLWSITSNDDLLGSLQKVKHALKADS